MHHDTRLELYLIQERKYCCFWQALFAAIFMQGSRQLAISSLMAAKSGMRIV
jgi:hypothetical protein